MPTMTERRAEIVARHQTLESVMESPWCPGHPGSPRARGETDLSARPVAFVGDRRVTFCGPCATAVSEALECYRTRCAPLLCGDSTPQDRRAVAACSATTMSEGADGVLTLCIDRGDWNDALHALAQEGVLVVSTGAV